MLFSSLTFLYAFLPATLLAYVICRTRQQRNAVLLVSSLIFYAWGEPEYLVLLIGMCVIDWYIGMRIDWAPNQKSRKAWLTLAIVIDLGLLCFFKYGQLFCSLFGDVPDFIKDVALPLGISFYTFQLISYLVDVYRGDVATQSDPLKILLYAGLFHQCIAGPIVRYKDVARELFVHRDARASLADGVRRFSWGLAKKVMLANACCELADNLLIADSAIADATTLASSIAQMSTLPVAALWLGMFAYALHIYLDFSAYSDMAIGLGLMVGLHYDENFDHPYISCSITEFWRRWHISLSTFFRDYVYISLGGSQDSVVRTIFNLFVVWTLTGLWHGASWTYALWGIYYFVFLFLEKYLFDRIFRRVPGIVTWLPTFIVIIIGWTIFKFTDMELLTTVFKGMFGLNGNTFTSFETNVVFENNIYLLALSFAISTPLFVMIGKKFTAATVDNPGLSKLWTFISYTFIPVVLLVLSTAMLVGNSYNPFIYFHF